MEMVLESDAVDPESEATMAEDIDQNQSYPESEEPSATMAEDIDHYQSYPESEGRPSTTVAEDIDQYQSYVFVGKTGIGKTTTCNKFIGVDEDFQLRDCSEQQKTPSGLRLLQTVQPAEGEKALAQPKFSVTESDTECQLISNESLTLPSRKPLQVLDVPGFAAENTCSSLYANGASADIDTHDRNLTLIKNIACIQKYYMRSIYRFVYFLPQRGIPEKADSVLQGELSVLQYIYGEKVFNHMVIVATNAQRFQNISFCEDDKKQVQKVFSAALKKVTGQEMSCCPPVIYISLDDSHKKIYDKLTTAKVIDQQSQGLQLDFKDDAKCSKCSSRVQYIEDSEHEVVSGKILSITNTSQQTILYNESKCHPSFTKQTSWSLGFGSFFGSSQPSVCVKCSKPHGTDGCVTVEESHICDSKISGKKVQLKYKVKHDIQRKK